MTKRVDAVLRSLGSISHSNLGGDRTSNFVGVIRGAELLLQLSSGEDVGAERVRLLIGELKRYFDHAFGDLGACQEGPGYTEYPGPFAFGAAFAARECGDATLYDTAAKHALDDSRDWVHAKRLSLPGVPLRAFSFLGRTAARSWGHHTGCHTKGPRKSERETKKRKKAARSPEKAPCGPEKPFANGYMGPSILDDTKRKLDWTSTSGQGNRTS
jgi:hypothetical protein